MLAVGIFSVGNPDTAAWNGMDSAVPGIVAGGYTQIIAQAIEAVAVAAFAFDIVRLLLAVGGCWPAAQPRRR